MRGRYLFSRYLGECFRALTVVVAIGIFAAAPAARAQRITDQSISALPVPEGPGDSSPSSGSRASDYRAAHRSEQHCGFAGAPAASARGEGEAEEHRDDQAEQRGREADPDVASEAERGRRAWSERAEQRGREVDTDVAEAERGRRAGSKRARAARRIEAALMSPPRPNAVDAPVQSHLRAQARPPIAALSIRGRTNLLLGEAGAATACALPPVPATPSPQVEAARPTPVSKPTTAEPGRRRRFRHCARRRLRAAAFGRWCSGGTIRPLPMTEGLRGQAADTDRPGRRRPATARFRRGRATGRCRLTPATADGGAYTPRRRARKWSRSRWRHPRSRTRTPPHSPTYNRRRRRRRRCPRLRCPRPALRHPNPADRFGSAPSPFSLKSQFGRRVPTAASTACGRLGIAPVRTSGRSRYQHVVLDADAADVGERGQRRGRGDRRRTASARVREDRRNDVEAGFDGHAIPAARSRSSRSYPQPNCVARSRPGG